MDTINNDQLINSHQGISAEDLRGIKDAIAVGFQKFINKDRNIYGKEVDRSHMRNPYNAGNYNYGSKDLPSNGTR